MEQIKPEGGSSDAEQAQNSNNIKQVLAEASFAKGQVNSIERQGPPSLEDYKQAEQALDELIQTAEKEGKTPKFVRLCQELVTLLNVAPDVLGSFLLVCALRATSEESRPFKSGAVDTNPKSFAHEVFDTNDYIVSERNKLIKRILSFGAEFSAPEALSNIQQKADLLKEAQQRN